MPDPAAVHACRGAPWTFDAAAFLACLRAVRHQTEGAPMSVCGVAERVHGAAWGGVMPPRHLTYANIYCAQGCVDSSLSCMGNSCLGCMGVACGHPGII